MLLSLMEEEWQAVIEILTNIVPAVLSAVRKDKPEVAL